MAHVRRVVTAPYAAFRDRRAAGRELAEFLAEQDARAEAVAAVPSGGVAVARPLARALGLPMALVLVRKLPLPQAPEAGFGAVSLEGDPALNEAAVRAWGMTDETVARVAARVQEELEHRRRLFAGERPAPDMAGRRVAVVDDGLASGYTMVAAVKELRRREPGAVCVAVPCAPLSTIGMVEQVADELYCLVAQRDGPFAVASFYERWHDLSDAEVLELLRDEPGREPGR